MTAKLKELGGWWRLWLIFAAITAPLGILMTFQAHDIFVEEYVSTEALGLSKVINWRDTQGGQCVPGSIQSDVAASYDESYPAPFHSMIWCLSWSNLFGGLALTILLPALVAMTGLAIRWVYRGFRQTAQGA
jgi:hypothetical protein